jgi:DNA polymerase
MEQEIEERKQLILAVAPEDVALDSIQSSWRSEWKKLGGGDAEALRIFVGKKVIGSGPRFAALLEAEGVDPPLKISPAWLKLSDEERAEAPDKQFIYAFAATDPAFMELLDDPDARIRALCEARVAVKSNTSITRAERLLRSGAGGRAMPVYYKYAGAHTWRFSGGDKQNWQNFKRGGELRLSILAPRGYALVVGDSSQIEARVNAWLWGQDDLIEAFRRGEDIYSLFATESIYGTKVTKADKERRHVGKTAILGLGYQMGAKKFRATLARGTGGPAVHLSEEVAMMIVQAYRKRYSKIAEGWTICQRIIEDMAAGRKGEYRCLRWEKETVWLPNGMRLKYPRLKQQDNGDWTYTRKGNIIKIYGGLLCENLVQALARIIVASDQLLEIAATYPVVMTTHDEVVACVKKAFAKKCEAFMQMCLKRPPVWAPDLPVTCETGYAENYSK